MVLHTELFGKKCKSPSKAPANCVALILMVIMSVSDTPFGTKQLTLSAGDTWENPKP